MPEHARDYQTIGEVVKGLSGDYPDLTVSKIRFLEDEGLIDPARTPGGYRKFAEDDLARIEVILRMQRDHFLPLAVIRERLADMDRGKTPEELRSAVPGVEAVRLPLDEATTLAIVDSPRKLGIPVEFVRELVRYGLVLPNGSGEAASLVRGDVEIAEAAWGLRKFGVEPRHLKMFDQFAEREASLHQQVLMPAARLRTPEARQRVIRQLDELIRLMEDVKSHLLHRALRRTFEDVT